MYKVWRAIQPFPLSVTWIHKQFWGKLQKWNCLHKVYWVPTKADWAMLELLKRTYMSTSLFERSAHSAAASWTMKTQLALFLGILSRNKQRSCAPSLLPGSTHPHQNLGGRKKVKTTPYLVRLWFVLKELLQVQIGEGCPDAVDRLQYHARFIFIGF